MRWLIAHVVAMAIPLWFDAGKSDGIDATIDLRIGIRGRPVFLTVAIANRQCVVTRGKPSRAGATATIGLADLIRIVIGDVGWPQLLSRGRFQLAGDPFLALRLPTLFRLGAAGRHGGTAAPTPVGSAR
jgi:hypothetical protein